MARLIKLFFAFFFIAYTPNCYSGTIKGYVGDEHTGEPIAGAVVLLQGTAHGTVTGLDGSYVIHNIVAGVYNIEIRYPSCETFRRSINISDTQTVIINHLLVPTSYSLDQVQIKGKLKNGSDEQARSMERNSDNILNIMSARTIELLPDITIANVLQRVSGVTVQRDNNGEARYAIIRGMDKRYNYTMINGVKIPSPDDKMRYVPMDIFPAEIVDRVEVIKTLTPNMEGDAIGGIINMIMRDAPDQFILYASIATGYNQTLFDRSYQGFPVSAVNLKDPLEMHGINYISTINDFQRRTGDLRNVQAPLNGLSSITIGNRFFKSKRLGAILTGSYQNTFKGSNNLFFLPSIQPGENNTPVITDVQIRNYSTQETRIGIHTKVDYRFNNKNSLSFYGQYLQLNEMQTRYIIDTSVQVSRMGAGTGQVDYLARAAVRKQAIKNITCQGKHIVSDNLNIDYTIAYSLAERDVPDMTELHTTTTAYIDSSHHSVTSPVYFTSFTHSWERTNDKDRSAYLNVSYTPSILSKDVELTTGGMIRNKNRTNYYNDYTLLPSSPNELYNNIYNTSMIVQQPSGDVNNDLNYSVTENIAAVYSQAKLVFQKFQVLGGVRYENTHEEYSMNVDPNAVAGQHAAINYGDILPGVHLKYALSRSENLRLSYFESISRPGFFELIPYHFQGEYYVETGNDSLNHSKAQNFDLRYDWFSKGIDQFLVGAFYKSISNPIEYLLANQPGKISMGELTPTNVIGNPATNYGAEIVISKYFHYFGVSANYTFTNSSITTTKLSRLRDSSGSLHNYTVSEKRPLQGQSAHVANLAVIYKNSGLGLDAHLSWVYTGRHIAFLSNFEGLDYWQKSTSFFDLSCEKRVFRRLFIYAKVSNLLNTPVIIELLKSKEMFITGNYQLPYQTLPNRTLVERDYYGRNYLIGLRYRLEQ